MGAFQPSHLLIVILVLVILFGAKKLPEVARGLGRSARILKSEVSGLHEDDSPPKEPQRRDSAHRDAPPPQLETRSDPGTAAPPPRAESQRSGDT